MCLTVPLRVISLDKDIATLENGRRVKTALVKRVSKGDWLLVQANIAVQKISPRDAEQMLDSVKGVIDELKRA